MSDKNDDKPATQGDLALSAVILAMLIILLSITDGCNASWRYRDLRDRLERLERR
jgi:hypothetical protein